MSRPYPRLSTVVTGPMAERLIAVVERYYPQRLELYVTSGQDGDHGANSYHYANDSYNGSPAFAVDFGAYDDPEPNSKDQQDMGLFADWWFENFWDLTVELIHTQPDNDHYTYVSNQQRIGGFGSKTDAAHVNHVHIATSGALLDQIEARCRARWGDGNGAPPPVAQPPSVPGTFPLPVGHYYGDINGPAESHGGFFDDEKSVVKQIQRKLQDLGFAPNVDGWADGLFEQATVDAVKAFQGSKGLDQDGKVGPVTWDAMMGTVQAPTPPPIDSNHGLVFGMDIYDFDVDRGLNEATVRGAVRTGGIQMMNAKLTENAPGGSWPHRKACALLRAAVSEGLTFPSSFIVPRTGLSVDEQIDRALEIADEEVPFWRSHADFAWQVDLEHWGYDDVAPEIGTEMAVRLMQRTQKPALLYGPPWAYGNSIPNYPGRKLWASNYSGSGDSRDYRVMYLGDSAPGWAPYSGSVPVLDQYCSDGQVNGYGPLVMTAFRGNTEAYRAMLRDALAPYNTSPEPIPMPTPIPPLPEPDPTPVPDPTPTPCVCEGATKAEVREIVATELDKLRIVRD